MIIIFDRWGISSSCVQPTRSLTRRISFVPTGLRSTVVRRHFFMTRIYNSSNRRGITIKDRQRRPLLKSLPISRRGNKSNNLNSWWCSKNNNKLRFSSSNKFSNCTNDASKSIRYVYSKGPFLVFSYMKNKQILMQLLLLNSGPNSRLFRINRSSWNSNRDVKFLLPEVDL